MLTHQIECRGGCRYVKSALCFSIANRPGLYTPEIEAPWLTLYHTELKKKRAFRKFSYRGIDLDQLLDLSSEQLRDVVHARARRRFNRGLKRKPMGLIKKLRKAKQEAKPNEKPDLVKTHLRDMIVVPEMIGSVVGIYQGKEFQQVEIKPEMVGHYLGEFAITYRPVKHGRPGIGATHSSRFIPLK